MFRLLSIVATTLALSTASLAAEQTEQSSSLSELPTFAQIKPAVDGVNGKVQVYGGAAQGNGISISAIPGLSPNQPSTGWNGLGGGLGTISVPIGHSFGAQIDLGAGAFGNQPLGNAAGHLFWRDPDKGLIGVYGAGSLLSDRAGFWTAAGEFEAYLGRFTGKALLGVQGSSLYAGGVNSLGFQSYDGLGGSNQANYFHDIVEATFYPLDDLALTIGHVYSRGRNAVTGEVEYLLPQFSEGKTATSAFVKAAYGSNDSSSIMGGIRIYFGNHEKTLIRRHREDDPAYKFWNSPQFQLPNRAEAQTTYLAFMRLRSVSRLPIFSMPSNFDNRGLCNYCN